MALNAKAIADFDQNGFVLLKSFYESADEIEPIQYGIYQIIALMIAKYHLPIEQQAFSTATFDSGYQELIAFERRIGGEVYDAVKQIPAFIRLVSNRRNEELFAQIRQTSAAGVAAGGYGIRIDNPGEERYRAAWHQEYPSQLRSVDGIVFWSPLVPISEAIGPVRICPGSHKDGLRRVHTSDKNNPGKTGAYGVVLEQEESVVANYQQIAPLTEPGDLMLIDFRTLHASGTNAAKRSRWSMQFRYFNFRDPTGIRHGWSGSFAAGIDFRQLHPELCVD